MYASIQTYISQLTFQHDMNIILLPHKKTYRKLFIVITRFSYMFSYLFSYEESDSRTIMDNRQDICLGVYSQANVLNVGHKLQ